MADKKEMRMESGDVILKDTVVESGILPQNTKELSRNVIVRGGSVIEGGVFGRQISIEEGNVTFRGAAYAQEDFHVSNDIKDYVYLKKSVASGDTVSAFLTSGRVFFGADINAEKVRLKNCFVGGSVFAQEIYLENCVVLGGVFATRQMTVSSCMIGTFYSRSVELAGINYLLYPTGFSTEPLISLPGTELYNISLAHLGALFKGEKEAENTGKIRMSLENDCVKTVLVDENNISTVVNSYSVSGRVLAADMIDMEKLENHFLIGAGALNTQILKSYSLGLSDGGKSQELTQEHIAEFFFDILSGKTVISDLSGEIKFSDIKKSFE